MIATRQATCPHNKIIIKIINNNNNIKLPIINIKPDRIDKIQFDPNFDIDSKCQIQISESYLDDESYNESYF